MANQLASLGPLAAMDYVQQQGDIGRQRGQQNQLNMLAGQSYGASTPEQQSSLLGQIAQINPQAAQAQQQQFQSQEDRNRNEIYGLAQGWKKIPSQYRQNYYDRFLSPRLSAMGMGEQPPYDEAAIDGVADQFIAAFGQQALGAQPTDVRSFEMMTQGLSAEDREKARRVQLGLDGRASSSGFSQVKVTGADGRERIGVLNGRTGQIDLPDGTSFNPQNGAITPTQGASQMLPPGGGQQVLEQDAAMANQMIAAGIPAEQVDAFLTNRAASFNGGVPPQPAAANNPSAFVGRAPEEQAAATEAAKLGVQQQYLPQELALRTDAALRQEAGKAAVSAQADQNKTQVTRVRDANTALDLLTQAEVLLPNATGSLAGAAYDRGAATFGRSTQGAQATAALKAIAGQLTSKMPRMEGPQSDKDVQLYKEMAGDLANDTLPVATRQAALRQIRGLQQKYASSVRTSDAPRQIQSADEYNALPSGALFIAPDGTQRRKR